VYFNAHHEILTLLLSNLSFNKHINRNNVQSYRWVGNTCTAI